MLFALGSNQLYTYIFHCLQVVVSANASFQSQESWVKNDCGFFFIVISEWKACEKTCDMTLCIESLSKNIVGQRRINWFSWSDSTKEIKLFLKAQYHQETLIIEFFKSKFDLDLEIVMLPWLLEMMLKYLAQTDFDMKWKPQDSASAGEDFWDLQHQICKNKKIHTH